VAVALIDEVAVALIPERVIVGSNEVEDEFALLEVGVAEVEELWLPTAPEDEIDGKSEAEMEVSETLTAIEEEGAINEAVEFDTDEVRLLRRSNLKRVGVA